MIRTYNATRWVATSAMSIAFLHWILATPGAGKPIDGKAADGFVILGKLMSRPLAERKVAGEDLKRFIDLWAEDNLDRKLCSLLAFAFAEDERSLDILRQAIRSDFDPMAGAARYALLMRGLAGDPGEPMARALGKRFRDSENPYERLFVANRLAVDYYDSSATLFLDALKFEPNRFVRLYILYFLYHKNDPDVDRAILSARWVEREALPEDMAFIMRSLTPGEKFQDSGRSAGEYLRDIRLRIRRTD